MSPLLSGKLIRILAPLCALVHIVHGNQPLAAATVYVIETPNIVNASSSLVRVSDGVVTDRHVLGLRTTFGANETRIVTIGSPAKGREVTVWDAASGQVLRVHNLRYDELVYSTPQRGGGHGGIHLDSEGKTALLNVRDQHVYPLTSIDLETGAVTQHEVPDNAMRVGSYSAGDSVLFLYGDGSVRVFSLATRSFSTLLKDEAPEAVDRLDHSVSAIQGIGLVRISKADGTISLVLDANWKRPPERRRFAVTFNQAPYFPLHLAEGSALCSIADDYRSIACTDPKDVSRSLTRTNLPEGAERLVSVAPHGPWAAFLTVDQKLLIINVQSGQIFKTIDLCDVKGQIIPYWPSLIPARPQTQPGASSQ